MNDSRWSGYLLRSNSQISAGIRAQGDAYQPFPSSTVNLIGAPSNIVPIAWHDMPMQMGNHIRQRLDVDVIDALAAGALKALQGRMTERGVTIF